MSRHIDDPTVGYYDQHAEEFAARTNGLDLSPLYALFLAPIPEAGAILDAGRGAGRDAKYFRLRAFSVLVIDASPRMVAMAGSAAGVPAQCLRFPEMDFDRRLDGSWACASLLHVAGAELDAVLARFRRALKPGGVCFLSFK